MNVLVNSLSDGFGGVESLFYNLIQCQKYTDIHFDFICPVKKCAREEDFLQSGSKVFFLPRPSRKLFDYIKKFKHIFSDGDYKIYHVNLTRYCFPLDIIIAKLYGVRVVIHCHSTQIYDFGSAKQRIIRKIEQLVFKPFYSILADLKIACSINAGKYLYGNSKHIILHNGIELDKYRFSEQGREKTRKEFDIEGKKVIGHVGRMSFEKNHHFLVNIFTELYKNDKDYRLLLVGDGDLYEELIEISKQRGLENKIIFAGQRSDVEDMLSSMDAFVLPSMHEALPIVLIEAQANGLPCIVSDNITNEVDATDLITRLPLESGISTWCKEIKNILGHKNTVQDGLADFNVVNIKGKLRSMYLDIVNN